MSAALTDHRSVRTSRTQRSELQMKQQVCIRTTQHKKKNVPLLTAADCEAARRVTSLISNFNFLSACELALDRRKRYQSLASCEI